MELRIGHLGMEMARITFIQMGTWICEGNSSVWVRVSLPYYFVEAYDTSVQVIFSIVDCQLIVYAV